MQKPSFESLLSPPWSEPEDRETTSVAYHLTRHQDQSDSENSDDEGLEHTVILGYN